MAETDNTLYIVKGSEITAVADAIRNRNHSEGLLTWYTGLSSTITGLSGDTEADAELVKMFDGTLVAATVRSSVTSLAQYRFYNFKDLQYLDFNQVKIIPSQTCYGCSNLTTVYGSAVETIQDSAFSGCTKLSTVDMPVLKTINSSAFSSCESLASFDLSSTESLASNAFYYCKKLSNLGGDLSHLKSVGSYALYYVGYDVPNNKWDFDNSSTGITTNIENYGCGYIKNIGLLKGKFNVGTYGFYYMNADQIQLDGGNLNAYAFYYASCNNTAEKPSYINCKLLGDANGQSGNSVFYYFGKNRSDNNMININCGSAGCFSLGSSVFNYLKYTRIELAKSISTISNNFQYCDNVHLVLQKFPAAFSNIGNNSTNFYVIFTDYNAYATALADSTWQALNLTTRYGAKGSTFGYEEQLPEYTADGRAITWYSDIALTTSATIVTDVNAYYYGSPATEVTKGVVTYKNLKNVDIKITNLTTGAEYFNKQLVFVDNLDRIKITIIPNPSDWIIYKIKLNGIEIQNDFEFVADLNVATVEASATETGGDPGWIFGVGDLRERTPIKTRIADSEDFSYNIYNNGFIETSFDSYLNFERIIDGTRVWVRIPTLYQYFDGENLKISNQPQDGFIPYAAFIDEDNNILPYIDIAAYPYTTWNTQVSDFISGQQVAYVNNIYQALTSGSSALHWPYLDNDDEHIYSHYDWKAWSIVRDLFLVVFGTTQVSRIFTSAGSTTISTGTTDSLYNSALQYPLNCCGKSATMFKFFGIEIPFYNMLIDGMSCNFGWQGSNDEYGYDFYEELTWTTQISRYHDWYQRGGSNWWWIMDREWNGYKGYLYYKKAQIKTSRHRNNYADWISSLTALDGANGFLAPKTTVRWEDGTTSTGASSSTYLCSSVGHNGYGWGSHCTTYMIGESTYSGSSSTNRGLYGYTWHLTSYQHPKATSRMIRYPIAE